MEKTGQGQGLQPCHKKLPALLKGKVPNYVFPRRGNPKQENRVIQHLQTQTKTITRQLQNLECYFHLGSDMLIIYATLY